jgi:hypothetical protein
MDNKILAKINQQVYAQFPYLKDTTPKIQESDTGTFELRYQGIVQTANGVPLPIVVKVVADKQGNIQKLVTSR